MAKYLIKVHPSVVWFLVLLCQKNKKRRFYIIVWNESIFMQFLKYLRYYISYFRERTKQRYLLLNALANQYQPLSSSAKISKKSVWNESIFMHFSKYPLFFQMYEAQQVPIRNILPISARLDSNIGRTLGSVWSVSTTCLSPCL